MSVFTKGVDQKALMTNALFIVGGLGVALTGAMGWFTLKIGTLRLPGWSMYVIGGALIAIGIVLVMAALNADKCPHCQAIADVEDLNFSTDIESEVKSAVENFDISQVTPKLVGSTDPNLELTLRFCPDCKKAAELSLVHFPEQYRSTSKDIVDGVAVPVEKVPAFIDYVQKYAPEEEE